MEKQVMNHTLEQHPNHQLPFFPVNFICYFQQLRLWLMDITEFEQVAIAYKIVISL